MACSWIVKSSKGFLRKELGTYRQRRHGEFGNLNFLSWMLLRKFGTEVSASEQMNLIRQLRERTSAPIKDVKGALLSCNWDIGRLSSFTLWVIVYLPRFDVSMHCTLLVSGFM